MNNNMHKDSAIIKVVERFGDFYSCIFRVFNVSHDVCLNEDLMC